MIKINLLEQFLNSVKFGEAASEIRGSLSCKSNILINLLAMRDLSWQQNLYTFNGMLETFRVCFIQHSLLETSRVSFIQHSLHESSLGWPLFPLFSWTMKMATTKKN